MIFKDTMLKNYEEYAMTEKNTGASKMKKSRQNTNKKREMVQPDPHPEENTASMFKKNEYAFIFLGAALLSIVIVFFFFRPAREPAKPVAPLPAEAQVEEVRTFEKRIEHIEDLLSEALGSDSLFSDASGGAADEKPTGLSEQKQRLARLETAFEVKFDSLAERLSRIEQQISALSNRVESLPAQPVKASTSKPVKKAQKQTVIKKTKSTKKEVIFHTVQKGETLYSISKKYKTTVAQLRKLNKLSENADIYPGNNILVK